jgi:translation elongation factor EF-Tu-like GTPase
MSNIAACRLKAKLHLLSTGEGGRQTAILTGVYRPQFHLGSVSASCRIDAIEGDTMPLGEKGDVVMTLLHPERFGRDLRRGGRFEICEGARVVGWGIIEEVEGDDRLLGTDQSVRRKVMQP